MTRTIGDVLVAVPPEARTNPYLAHSALYKMFAKDGERDFIFSYEADLGSVARVRSRHFGDAARALMIPLAVPEVGQEVAFRLVAAPARKDSSSSKRREGFKTDAERLLWLQRKALAAGFELVGETAVQTTRTRLTKSNTVFFVDRAVFTGTLRVTDKTLFAQALEAGIGPSKAIGFGLLTLH